MLSFLERISNWRKGITSEEAEFLKKSKDIVGAYVNWITGDPDEFQQMEFDHINAIMESLDRKGRFFIFHRSDKEVKGYFVNSPLS
jgi:hypothetical protein